MYLESKIKIRNQITGDFFSLGGLVGLIFLSLGSSFAPQSWWTNQSEFSDFLSFFNSSKSDVTVPTQGSEGL